MAGCPLNFSIEAKPELDDDCSKKLTIAHDIVDVLGGKWRMEVIMVLLQFEKRRFNELQKDIAGVSSRILSGVLKDLEVNHIVLRTAINTVPVTVEYELTDYGKSMKQAIVEFIKLGVVHRREVMRG